MVARADLWVYDAENFCVSFFNQVASIFHLQGEKKFFWAYLLNMVFDKSLGSERPTSKVDFLSFLATLAALYGWSLNRFAFFTSHVETSSNV